MANRKRKMQLRAQLNLSARGVTTRIGTAEIQHMLPKMNANDDALTFVHPTIVTTQLSSIGYRKTYLCQGDISTGSTRRSSNSDCSDRQAGLSDKSIVPPDSSTFVTKQSSSSSL